MLPENAPVVEDVAASLAPARYPFWGWVDFAIFIGLLVALVAITLFAAGFATLLVPALKTDPTPLLLPTQVSFYIAIYFAFYLVFTLRHDKPVFASLGWQRTVGTNTLMAIGFGGALLSPAVSLVASLLHTPEVHMEMLDKLEKKPLILALFGLMAVTVAPLFEELLFRGFLQPLFSRTLGVIGGILLTSVLFGSLHAFQYKFVWQYVAAVSFVGVVLGAVRYRTGSIIPSTIMHACYNAIFVIEMAFKHK